MPMLLSNVGEDVAWQPVVIVTGEHCGIVAEDDAGRLKVEMLDGRVEGGVEDVLELDLDEVLRLTDEDEDLLLKENTAAADFVELEEVILEDDRALVESLVLLDESLLLFDESLLLTDDS